MPLLYGIRHAWPEQAGFCLNRRKGYPGYSFVHFLTSVEIVIDGVRTVTPNHTCIIYAPGTPQYFIARQPLVHDWFHFSEMPEGLPECLDLPLDTLLYPRQPELITAIVQEMESEYFSRKSGSTRLIMLKMTELFIKLSRSLSDEYTACLLYTSDAADDLRCVDIGGRRNIKKKKRDVPKQNRSTSTV